MVFLLLFLGTAAVAEEPHGVRTHDMYTNCKTAIRWWDNENVTTSEMLDGSYCAGYIRGVADEMTNERADDTQYIEVKGNVTTEALVKSFVNYVNAHPVDMDNPNVTLVFTKAWATDEIISLKTLQKRVKQ